MHSILFQVGPLTIYSYGFMLAVAVLVCSFLLSRDAAKAGISSQTVYDLFFWVVLSGILGARLFYVFVFSWEYFATAPLEILFLNQGGLAWQGGLMGGALAGVWFARSRRLSLRVLLDLSAPYVALGQSIGRIGCFLQGCCYGKPWAHGLMFPGHASPIYPTQLFETAALFVIFLILRYAQKTQLAPGLVFALYLWLAAIERFIVEFYRDDHSLLWLNLSLSQFVCLGIFAAGVIVYLNFKKVK